MRRIRKNPLCFKPIGALGPMLPRSAESLGPSDSEHLATIERLKNEAIERSKDLTRANVELEARQAELKTALAKHEEIHARLEDEIEDKSRIERELQMAHKLEAVGQLASGIAHEINTPTQYIGNNVHFLADAFTDLQMLLAKYKEAIDARADTRACNHLALTAQELAKEIDIGFLYEEIPDAFTAITEGIGTISTIVGAMRNFAHPDSDFKELGDINRAIESTLAVAHSEYRYQAIIKTDFDEVPMIPCLLGGLNQVFLNLVVNAAHAIADSGKSLDEGIIAIKTWADDDAALLYVTIKDNGCGMSLTTRARIFDPFFTTKEVGRGTGQGLSIAQDIIVNKHQGQITADSRLGKGTTFTISLPL